MPELLLELGCEELPASFVRKAYTDLESAVTTRLKEAGIPFGSSQSLGTPRRLIIQVQDAAARQPDIEKVQRGPGIAAAYDPNGNPTKALEGFCRGQGVQVSDLRKEADYVWVTKTIPGKPTAEVLAEILPASIRGLTFDKAMRWGSHRLRFARPIRWILAAFDGAVVKFDIDGIESGEESRGHRFYQPELFKATSFDQLVKELRNRKVEPDEAARRTTIEQGVKAFSGNPVMSADLLDENVFLTEWPTAIEGMFKEEYLDLPVPVLVTTMAKHEKFFPVKADDGNLTNRFVSIRNGGVDEVVSKGNTWVLNARFNDAKFFYDEDQAHTLDGFLEKTKGIFFQEKLGTVHQRAYRLSELAQAVAIATDANQEETDYAAKAGLYAKADLSTGLVSELPALQGLIGAEYAKREGFPDAVCWALASQYDFSKNPTIDCEGARTATRLIIADQLDKLAGYFGIGQVPSGSSDPYGLRRAATVLIEAALRWSCETFCGYEDLFEKAQELYQAQGFELVAGLPALSEVFLSRYNAIFSDSRYDLVEAAVCRDYLNTMDELDPQLVRFRISVLEKLSSDIPFIQTATRPQNIVSAAVTKGIPFTFHDPLAELADLQSESGDKLADLARTLLMPVVDAATDEHAEALILHLKSLEGPINAFFDSTMVMAEDETVRAARLSLLHGVNLLLRFAGDFSKIVVSGE